MHKKIDTKNRVWMQNLIFNSTYYFNYFAPGSITTMSLLLCHTLVRPLILFTKVRTVMLHMKFPNFRRNETAADAAV